MANDDKIDYYELKTKNGHGLGYYYYGRQRVELDLRDYPVFIKENITIRTSSNLNSHEGFKERPVYHRQVNMRFTLRPDAKMDGLGFDGVHLKYRLEWWIAVQDAIDNLPDDDDFIEERSMFNNDEADAGAGAEADKQEVIRCHACGVILEYGSVHTLQNDLRPFCFKCSEEAGSNENSENN